MTSTASYALRSNDILLDDVAAIYRRLLHDSEETFNEQEVKAFAASGDCLAMLANDLDQMVMLFDRDSAERYQLQRIVDILLYLQDNYEVRRRL